MFAPDFGYLRAGSVAEAGQLLAAHPGAKILAGGHSLIPLLKLRLAAPTTLVDIGRIEELKGVALTGESLRIGALTTHAELAASDVLRQHSAALSDAAGQVGDPAVRNRGTIGGNVAHADPASDLPTVLVALGATCVMSGPDGERRVGVPDFFQGLMTTDLGEGELLTAVELPAGAAGQGSAYAKFAHPASRYAVIGAAATVTVADGRVASAAVAVGGLVPAPVRAESVERALSGQAPSDEAIASAATAVAGDLGEDLLGDLFASAEYRKAVVHVYVRRALSAAVARATQG